MQLIWFKGPYGQLVKFDCREAGLHVPTLAAHFQLKPRPLMLNDVVVDYDRDGYKSMDAAYLVGYGVEDNPVLVTGQPADERPTGVPRLYHNVILHIAGDSKKDELVRQYKRVSRATLQKVLDMQGCDVVLEPGTQDLVSFDVVDLQDNMLLKALRHSVPWDARVSTLEGFVESSVKGFEADALE